MGSLVQHLTPLSRLSTAENFTMVKLAKPEGMPKRPMSAYFLWMNEEGRATAQKENEGAGVAEISKACGVGWKMEERSFWTLQRKTRKARKQKKLLRLPRKRGGMVRGEEGQRRSRNLRTRRKRRRRKTASKCRVDNTAKNTT